MTHDKPLVFLDVSINSDPAEKMIFELFYDAFPETTNNFRALCTDESFSLMKHNGPGYLSMGNTGPNQNDSQFFIAFKQEHLLDGSNVVFGKLVHGHNTLKKIKNVGSENGEPAYPVKIVKCGELLEGKKTNKLKSKDGSSDVDSHEGKKKGNNKKSSRGRRKKARKRYYTSESNSSSVSDTESSESDSDTDYSSSSSDNSSSSDDRRKKRKRSHKRDKYKRSKRRRVKRREKRQKRRDKRSRRKSIRTLESSSDTETESSSEDDPLPPARKSKNSSRTFGKKKTNKLKSKDASSDVDCHEGKKKGNNKKSSRGRRKKERRRYFTSESDSSSVSDAESSESDSDTDYSSSSSDNSSSSDDRRKKRKRSHKRDKYKRSKRRRVKRREKRQKRRDKRSRRKSKRTLENSNDTETESSSEDDPLPPARKSKNSSRTFGEKQSSSLMKKDPAALLLKGGVAIDVFERQGESPRENGNVRSNGVDSEIPSNRTADRQPGLVDLPGKSRLVSRSRSMTPKKATSKSMRCPVRSVSRSQSPVSVRDKPQRSIGISSARPLRSLSRSPARPLPRRITSRRYRTSSPNRSPVKYSSHMSHNDRSSRHYRNPIRGRTPPRSRSPERSISSSPVKRTSRKSITLSPIRPLSRSQHSYSRSPGHKGRSSPPSCGRSASRSVSPDGSPKRIRKGRGFTRLYSYARRYKTPSPNSGRSVCDLYSSCNVPSIPPRKPTISDSCSTSDSRNSVRKGIVSYGDASSSSSEG